MKTKILLAISLITGIYSAHANNCGTLNVSVFNKSGHTCTLRAMNLINGQIIIGQAPGIIANGEKAPSFTLQQTYSAGPNIRLEYECDNKTISIVSRQDLCVMYAGAISGSYSSSNNVHADFLTTIGSWWSSLPGEIHWTIG
ncbi:hypothetical protein [Legionella sp. PC997]|uniref:hypothetical protein n=1 Tax=Legionella sp. PC997 TaxID=2755562 RepID=UPI0015F90F96|nr:hypothetical protein [Legionella sp. PC997]QMT59403.1 hypothetical protein HBNCFIEN_00769 [Legionella sp. PC997]